MKRILPKIIGLALVAGVASFILAMIAKLLIGATIIGLAVFYIKSLVNSQRSNRHQRFGDPRFSQGYLQAQHSPFKGGQSMPFGNPQHNMGIIPIN